MEKPNYQKELDGLLAQLASQGHTPSLLLHACCAPCSSYVLEYLSPYFKITVFAYNPNISPQKEYRARLYEQLRLIREMPTKNPVEFLEGTYAPADFYNLAQGMEGLPEGGERCFACYRLRLEETARRASEGGFDYFASTLSLSPYKNAQKLNEIGQALAESYQVAWLPNDFKKKNGYRRSVELSRQYGLYRQDYCGCVYSFRQRHPACDVQGNGGLA